MLTVLLVGDRSQIFLIIIYIYQFAGSCRRPPSMGGRSLSLSIGLWYTCANKHTSTVLTSKLTYCHASLCKNTCWFWSCCFTEQSELLDRFSFIRRAAQSYPLSIIQLNKMGDGAREIRVVRTSFLGNGPIDYAISFESADWDCWKILFLLRILCLIEQFNELTLLTEKIRVTGNIRVIQFG